MKVIIGQYMYANSWIHKIDPRIKLVAVILIIASTFFITSFYSMLAFLLITIVIVKQSKIPIKAFLKSIMPLLFLLFFTFLFQILLNKKGDLLLTHSVFFSFFTIMLSILVIILYNLLKNKFKYRFLFFLLMMAGIFVCLSLNVGSSFTFNITIYSGGLFFAAFLITRIVILVSISSLLTMTTKPTDLNNGLEKIMKPLKKIKVPTEEIAMMISIALRFIPTLFIEATKIMKAQASRGVDFQEGKLKDKVKQIISLLIPMFVISFKRADDLANAMEARGYVPGGKRTKYVVYKMKVLDYVILFVTLSIIPGVIYFGL